MIFLFSSPCCRAAITLSRRNFHSDLLPNGPLAYINGKWIASQSRHNFDVHNPANGNTITSVTNCDHRDAQLAIDAAKGAFPNWGFNVTAKERAALLLSWSTIMMRRQDELAKIMTIEQGKPLAEARGEIAYAASFFDWYAGEARRIYGQIVPSPSITRQHLHMREPSGVVAMITPWNFPSAMIARKTAAALAAGCTVVVKPAEDTPLSALALATTAQEAGIPPGIFNVVPADRTNTAAIGQLMCESPNVDVISFTGSTAVGKLLLQQSASTVKRVCLELGGNAPLIVFASADIAKAVAGTMASKFRCSGQTCVSANRIFVHSSVHDTFVLHLQRAINEQLKVGDGTESGVTQGPLINSRAVEKIEQLVDDAKNKGAKIVCGGARRDSKVGNFFEPTIITNIQQNMTIAQTEIFGPVVAIARFENEDDVLKLANNTRSGLAGYIFTQDLGQIWRVSRRLQVGMIGVNEGLMSCTEAAFGGVKESGLGREGGSQGIDEFTNWKYLCLAT